MLRPWCGRRWPTPSGMARSKPSWQRSELFSQLHSFERIQGCGRTKGSKGTIILQRLVPMTSTLAQASFAEIRRGAGRRDPQGQSLGFELRTELYQKTRPEWG